MPTDNNFNLVAQNTQSTVVAEFKPEKIRATSYQSEAELEQAFIKQLQTQAYEYISIKSEEDLITNFSFVEALKDTINFFDSIFEKNSIKCQFTYDTDMVVNCNRNDFSQAILNILDNSVYALIQN